ncbi:hypothetical protein QR680_015549 [Steinernema hermaphroditum]|uniref:Uncharacterized protein n=1 Tax=Steinernema hermaphroditum TaxID=289476 RepID=A0AA39LL30_9BILA|nr:hypothetical protein QR680_015549 [Steinernema hermaphroditum]
MADLKSCWYPSRPNVTTAAVLIAVIDILAAILLILLNVANKIPDDLLSSSSVFTWVAQLTFISTFRVSCFV